MSRGPCQPANMVQGHIILASCNTLQQQQQQQHSPLCPGCIKGARRMTETWKVLPCWLRPDTSLGHGFCGTGTEDIICPAIRPFFSSSPVHGHVHPPCLQHSLCACVGALDACDQVSVSHKCAALRGFVWWTEGSAQKGSADSTSFTSGEIPGGFLTLVAERHLHWLGSSQSPA